MTLWAAGLMSGVVCAALTFGQSPQSDGPVVGVGPILHMVANLDESTEFYRDKLGFELSSPADDHKFVDDPAVANLYGVPGRQFPSAVLKIPGSKMRIELVQWNGSGSLGPRPLSADGYATLTLFRADGSPYRTDVVRDREVLQDPDGLQVHVARVEQTAVHLAVNAEDIAKTVALYTEEFGFKANGRRFSLPGTSTQIILGHTRPSDVYTPPARAMLRLQVRDIDGLTASLKNEGLSIVTTGGAPITLPQGRCAIIVRDPNNFYLELMETH
jgi:catechol 2,3-dioxygenase-like lactoylglutathione lyase family enzyme/predicted enzyme related to lactoylglutathione lyase